MPGRTETAQQPENKNVTQDKEGDKDPSKSHLSGKLSPASCKVCLKGAPKTRQQLLDNCLSLLQ
jgi:hypothetical protein